MSASERPRQLDARNVWRFGLGLSLVVVFSGCSGDILGRGGGDGRGDGDGNGNGADASLANGLRRLSHTEYNHTVRDLFTGIDVQRQQFVADPIPYGFDNDQDALAVTSSHIGDYFSAAVDIAQLIRDNLDQMDGFLSCTPADADSACCHDFVDRFGAKAFRRPLTSEESGAFYEFCDTAPGQGDLGAAVQLTVQAMLQSPQFLYRLEGDELTPYDVASRLSYFFWQSLPDDELFAAAAADELGTAEQVEQQARRMLDDPRAERGFLHFFEQWMEVDRVDQVSKLPQDNFDRPLRNAMMEESHRFITDVIFARDGSLSDLFNSTTTFVNARLADLYGVAAPDGQEWAEVDLGGQRAGGFLTQTAFLTGHGHPNNPSPVLRGVFVLDRVMCRALGAPPPEAQAAGIPGEDGSGAVTNREEYEAATANSPCNSCHQIINPVGFAFENFDTLGRFRDTDNGAPVDATGALPDGRGFDGATTLTSMFGEDPEVADCMTEHWIRYAFGGGDKTRSRSLRSDLSDRFASADLRLRELLVAIATHPEFFERK